MTATLYWIRDEESEWSGPYTIEQLQSMWISGAVNAATYCCTDTAGNVWRLAAMVHRLAPAPVPLRPIAVPGERPDDVSPVGHISVALLGLLIWPVGVILGLAYSMTPRLRPRGQLLLIWSAVGLFVTLLLAAAMFGFGGNRFAARSDPQPLDQSLVSDLLNQYDIARRNGSAVDAYLSASMLKATYLQLQDELNYRRWKLIEATEARRAGLPPP